MLHLSSLSQYDWGAIALLLLAGIVGGWAYLAGSTYAAAIAAGTIATGAILASPLIGLALVLAALPIDGLTLLVPDYLTLTKFLSALVLLSLMPRLPQADLPSVFSSRTLRWWLLLPVWTFLLLPVADHVDAGWMSWTTEVLTCGLSFMIAVTITNPTRLRFMCLVSVSSVALLAIVSLLPAGERLFNVASANRLAAGTNPNILANIFAVALFLSAIAWHYSSGTTKIVLLGMDAVILVAIGLTASRGTWLAILVALVAGLLFSRRISLRTRLGLGFAVLLLGSAAFVVVSFNEALGGGEAIMRRMESLSDVSSAEGTRLTYIWPHYLQVIADSPWFGGGPGKMLGDNLSTHSDYLMFLAEKGVPGLLLYLCFIAASFREAMRNHNEWLRLSGMIILVYLLSTGLTHTTQSSKSYAIAVGMLACLAQQDARARKRQRMAQFPASRNAASPTD